jgi:K+-sensing histidine kinase KdpD
VVSWVRLEVLSDQGDTLPTSLVPPFLLPAYQQAWKRYLFIVLYLVYARGIRTAILAAFIGCATLDFLFVPPVLSITVSQVEDGWELCIFLLFAIALSRSYSRLLNRIENVKRQRSEESLRYEEASVMWVMQHAKSVVISDVPLISHQKGSYLRRVVASNSTGDREVYRRNFLVPLISGRRVLGESGEKVLGVMHLLLDDIDHAELASIKKSLELPSESPETQPELFPKLLDHTVFLIEQSLIERALMQQETLNRELQKRTEELHTAIISSVSHDFHSPLTLIKGAASSLQSQGLQSYDEVQYRQTLEAIVSEANWLERIVMRMLDLSRFEQGALKLEKEIYPIEEIILYTLVLQL